MADIHPQLQKDCLVLGRLKLSHVLLVNDTNYPWFILVPDRANITELYQLCEQDRNLLWQESCELSRVLIGQFKGDKLNIAAIGNLVPQLHLHHVVRYKNDPAWPAPVWGKLSPVPYRDEALKSLIDNASLTLLPGFCPV